jgi:hypothetical protein
VLPCIAAAQGVAAQGTDGPPGVARGATAPGQPSWRQDFEGPTPSWTEAGGDAQYSMVAHQRVRGGAHSGQGSEWLQVNGQGGSSALIAHDIGRPWVIDELRPSVWIFSDRPGIQFFAEVTLPRSLDPRSGKPVTANVDGVAYSTTGRWQRLEIVDFAKKVAGQVRILRSQGMNVDGREAFVSRVLLNVYGGPGVTNVWIDDLEVYGYVASNPVGQVANLPPSLSVDKTGPLVKQVGNRGSFSAAGPFAGAEPNGTQPDPPPPPRQVKLAGSVLKINDFPIFPRAIEYRGERLSFLKELGFNTVWLRQVPAPAFLSEARRLGLWLVCPPPELQAGSGEQGARSGDGNGSQLPAPSSLLPAETIGPEFEPVLVWDLGHGLTGDTLDATRRRADRLLLADARYSRPLICSPINNLRNYSRPPINLLLIDRRPLGTSLQMPDYGVWVQKQPLLALPGTPVWTTVQTQAGEGLRRQFAALTPGHPEADFRRGESWRPPTVVGPEQIRLLVYTAISSGSRGLLFLSDSSLEAQDSETRQRVMALHLLNLELEVIEPWAAGGKIDATAVSSQKLVSGVILQNDRARIVMPMWLAPGSQCVAPLAAAKPLYLTLPGIPESSNIFELTAGCLEPLRHRREAGGTRVTFDNFGLSSLLFVAQDPMIIEAVSRRAAVSGKQTSQLEAWLAAQKLDTATHVMAQIGNRMPQSAQLNPAREFDDARRYLQLCNSQLNAGDYALASASARLAMMPLRKVERAAWDAAMAGRDSPVTIPGTSSFQALPWHWALVDRTAGMRIGANLLPGGDFENLDQMVRFGWRHIPHATPGIQTAADLVPEAAHNGGRGLRLTAWPVNPEKPPAAIEMPPLWIASPAVPVKAGQIVRIHGWINVPAAITASVDGLMIVESLTGEEMALRLNKTAGWQEFSMVRIVPQDGPLSLTLAMTGLGEVRLDDLTIEVLQ